ASPQETRVFIPSRARGADNPRCAKRRSHYDPTAGNGMPSAHDAGGRLVQWTAGRRRSRRDSRLIVKTSPRFTVNWPALASSILEDSGPVFTNRRCGAISPVRSVPDPPASTAPRAREEIKTHARHRRARPRDGGEVLGLKPRSDKRN